MDRICVALDVEMTGTQAGVDEIIEVAAVKFRGNDVLETFSQLVRPRQSLPLKITRLTGITPADLADAPEFNTVAVEFVRFLKNYPLVGHSVDNDLRFLSSQGMNFNQPVYDTFDLATLLLPQVSAYRLSSIGEYLGIAQPADHRALNDADVSRQVFLRLVERIEALDVRELTNLNALMQQTDWTSRALVEDILKSKAGNALRTPISTTPSLDAERSSQGNGSQGESALKPTGNSAPLELAEVAACFAPDGVLGRHFTQYEQRPQQVEMAEAVARALNESDALIVEAGTGTGKSMAYLLPAAMFALQRGERVVVSTNTINLQDQLFYKDLPDVQRMLNGAAANEQADAEQADAEQADDGPLKIALMKGRSNYLCLRRYKALRREESLHPHEARALLKVQFWLPATSSGDRAELPLIDKEHAAWGRINVTPDTCTGHRCADFRECFFFRARRKAEAAHVVVVNHALLLADLVAQSNVLPPYDHLVVDEAHNLEDVATDQLGFQLDRTALLNFLDSLFTEGGAQTVGGLLSEYQLSFKESSAEPADRERADQIASTLRPQIERARQATYECFNHLLTFMTEATNAQGSYESRLRLTPAVRKRGDWGEVERAWENLTLLLNEIGSGLGQFETLLNKLEHADLLSYDELLLRVQWLQRYVTDVRIQSGHVIFGDEESICWLSYDQFRNELVLHAAPLHVADILQAQLFAEKQTSVLTSATLSINGSFEFVRGRLGLPEPEEVQLDSPFDYEKQALLFIPNDIPEPSQRGYQPALEAAMIALCKATRGRTLALFTANSALRQTYLAIQEDLEDEGITLLAQGIDGSRRALLERFKEWPHTVLLGTSSFWEGVDVVGDALSVLVIAKLPFSVPSDPVFAARSEQFGDPFSEYAVPQSILRFKQGFGRLIRSRDDRGIVVVLDKRLLSKKYGQQFLQSLPNTSVRTGTLQHLPSLAARFIR